MLSSLILRMARMAKKNTGWIIAQNDLEDDGCSLHHYYTTPIWWVSWCPFFQPHQKRSGQNPQHRKFWLRSGLLFWFCCRFSWYFWKNHPSVLPRSLHIPTKPRIFMYSSPDFKHIRISMDVPRAFSLLWSENGSKPRYAIFGMNIQIYHDLSQRFYAVSGWTSGHNFYQGPVVQGELTQVPSPVR